MEASNQRHRELQPLLASTRGLPTKVDGPIPLNGKGRSELHQALRRSDVEKLRLLLSTAPKRDVLLAAAHEAGIDLSGSGECARLLRCALEREASLEEEERIGRQMASEAVKRTMARVR